MKSSDRAHQRARTVLAAAREGLWTSFTGRLAAPSEPSMRAFLAALILLAAPAFADETTVEIVAYDRLANILVAKDKTVWELGPNVLVPADLQAGDRVRIVFRSAGDSGWGKIERLERVSN